ncbi:hypothetical protein PYW07_013483 [Mythimna separata]|uniref:Uncharacterized protein n=1 Tax=Mythimna separata TaxID=271217 RepID=A0AAD7Y6P5_MYTSE|nr:hypothetical protein PYW07_013483 [Mythimna separata]
MLNSWKKDHDQRLTNWKTEQDAVLSLLVKDVSEHKLQCSVIQKTAQELEVSMAYINKDYEDMKTKLSNLEDQNLEKGKSISHLQKQIQELNLQFRPATIELRNVPVKEDEKPEDLVAIVSGVGKAVDLDINKSNLRDIYRLPGSSFIRRYKTDTASAAEAVSGACRRVDIQA